MKKCKGMAALALATLALFACTGKQSENIQDANTINDTILVDTSTVSTPAQALQRLIDGNERYVAEENLFPHHDHKRMVETTPHQHPFVAIVACSDSRVPVELIFDQGIGDIFTIRTAGNNVNGELVIGSVDYAVEHLGVKLLVVLGHKSCGGLTGAIASNEHEGCVGHLLDIIRKDVPQYIGQADSLDAAIHYHAQAQVARITAFPHVKERIEQGQLIVKSAYYDIESGKVIFD